MSDARQEPIEFRSGGAIAEVSFPNRLITVVAVPYNQETEVSYRDEIWQESFLPGAFDGIETRANRVRVNREHDESTTFGGVLSFHPNREEGLVAEVKVSKTARGDEALELANDGHIGVSPAFQVRNSDQELDRPHRRIKKAFIRHLSFVEVPAYDGAGVLSVRGRDSVPLAADLPPLVTPNLDEVLAWLKSRP